MKYLIYFFALINILSLIISFKLSVTVSIEIKYSESKTTSEPQTVDIYVVNDEQSDLIKFCFNVEDMSKLQGYGLSEGLFSYDISEDRNCFSIKKHLCNKSLTLFYIVTKDTDDVIELAFLKVINKKEKEVAQALKKLKEEVAKRRMSYFEEKKQLIEEGKFFENLGDFSLYEQKELFFALSLEKKKNKEIKLLFDEINRHLHQHKFAYSDDESLTKIIKGIREEDIQQHYHQDWVGGKLISRRFNSLQEAINELKRKRVHGMSNKSRIVSEAVILESADIFLKVIDDYISNFEEDSRMGEKLNPISLEARKKFIKPLLARLITKVLFGTGSALFPKIYQIVSEENYKQKGLTSFKQISKFDDKIILDEKNCLINIEVYEERVKNYMRESLADSLQVLIRYYTN
jgi:hypothetical protein